jgi:hypothetical protein
VSDGHTFKLRRRFFDLENAKTHSINIAKELAQQDEWDGYWVFITDDKYAEIARMPITNAHYKHE